MKKTNLKVIVYSTNLKGYDALHDAPPYKFNMSDDFQYLYYTDDLAPNGWEKIEMQGDSRKESRYYKINSHKLPPHDISIYVDASFNFTKGIKNWVDFVSEHDIAIAKHGKDENIYEHIGTCIHAEKDDPKKMIAQVSKYINEGLPEHILTENGIIIRRNNANVKLMNEIWWSEYIAGSERDQLSLPYALWKSGVKMTLLPFSVRENEYCNGWNTHKKHMIINYQDSPLWNILKEDYKENLRYV